MLKKLAELFKPKEKEVIITSDEDSINSITLLSERLIENESTNLIILIKYTDKYSDDAIVFLEAFTGYYKFRHSAWTEKTGVDEKGRDIMLAHVERYLLISGWIGDYVSLFDNIDNIDNPFVQTITKDIYEHLHGESFKVHIQNGILSPSAFKDEHSNGTIDQTHCILYTDYKALLEKLPAEFNLFDILDMCDVALNDSLYNYRTFIEAKNDPDILHDIGVGYNGYCNAIFKNINLDDIRQALKQPRYLLSDETIQGSMEEYELSEIFKAEYDRYTMPIVDESDGDIKFEDLIGEDDDSIEIIEDLGEIEE